VALFKFFALITPFNLLNRCQMSNIASITRARLLAELKTIQAERKIVILDKASVRIVDSVLTMAEILDCGVFLVENVALGRQPYPQMAAVYIVGGSEETAAAIGKDWVPPTVRLASGRTGPMYREAHLLFVSSVSSTVMAQLAASAVAPHVRTFREMRLDYVAAEARFFHTSTMRARGSEPADHALEDSIGPDTLAARVADACLALGVRPSVRYRKASSKAGAVAARIQQKIEASSSGAGKGSVGVLLVVDREMDLLAPLLHEFTLQAMAADLLDLGVDGNRYTPSSSGPKRTGGLLDDRDATWMALRHVHVADASKIVVDRFNAFVAEAPVGPGSSSTGKPATITSLKDMMAALGGFQEAKAAFALHISLIDECLAISGRKALPQLAVEEQLAVLHTDADGEPAGDRGTAIASHLSRPVLSSADRTRLLALYFLSKKSKVASGMDADEEDLVSRAGLEPIHMAALRKILANRRLFGQRRPNRTSQGARPSVIDDEPAYDSSRFIPALHILMEDLAYGQLDPEEFPFIRAGDHADSSTAAAAKVKPGQPAGGGAAPVSLRTKPHSLAAGGVGSVDGPTGSATVVVVLGGVTYSEVRAAYAVSERLRRDIVLGSDFVLTPERFLNLMADRGL
jgi:syntaxin-binding protein 1